MSWVNITHMVTHLSMRLWFVWPNGGAIVTCWLMVTVTLVLWMVTEPPLSVTLRRVCQNSPWKCSVISTKILLIFKITTMVRNVSQLFCHHVFLIYLLMAQQGLPLVWRPISHRTICLRQLMLSN